MCEILRAETCVLSPSLRASLVHAFDVEERAVDIFLVGNRYLWFVVQNRGPLPQYLRFPILADSQQNSAPVKMGNSSEGDDSLGLLKALREASKSPIEACSVHTHCSRSVVGISVLYTNNLHLVLLLIMRCNCMVIASFVLNLSGSASNAAAGIATVGLTAVRWITSSLPHAPRQRHSPVSALLERTGFHFVLRVAFVRALGWAEYLELSWHGEAATPWDSLTFASLTLGPLRLLEEYDSIGEVRAIRWMPGARDYTAALPLLAVLHQYAELPGDPFLDRLTVCMVNVRPADPSPSSIPHTDKWAKNSNAIIGSCVEGPWCLSALTLAHPSFLLQTTALLAETSGVSKVEEVLGVFLRPSTMVYPASAVLREWTDDESPEFRFALYTAEHGEVASCPVGGFVETAVYCSTIPRRTGTDQLLATVLAGKADGGVLLLEIWAKTNSQKVIVIQSRFFAAWYPSRGGALPHIYRILGLKWDGTTGSASLLETRCIESSSRTDFCLSLAKLAARGVTELEVTWQNDDSPLSRSMCSFTSIYHCWPQSSEFMSAGSLSHSFFQPLCRCDWLDNDELVLTRSGDLWRIAFSTAGSIINCFRMSRVQRPSSVSDTEALRILFSSDAADVCVTRHASELLIAVRDTAILMTIEGCVSSTYNWGIASPLYPCMINSFASYNDVHAYVLCVTQALPKVQEGCRDCFFILLQLIDLKGNDPSPSTSMRVVDVCHANMDGHPIFDWLPKSLPIYGFKMSSTEMVLCLRELVYYSRGILFSLPCAIVNSSSIPSVFQCRFGEPRELFALQELLPVSSEPTLLKCSVVKENIGIIILSFVDGPALAVRISCGRWWECQLIPCEAPLIRFAAKIQGRNGCGLVQDATGSWHSLRFSDIFDTSGGSSIPVELLSSFMHRTLTNSKPLTGSRGTPFIVHKEGELFVLDSCNL